jgi:hypothetical protein
MDIHMDVLDHTQLEFQECYENRIEDTEDEAKMMGRVLGTQVNLVDGLKKDVSDLEALVDNSHHLSGPLCAQTPPEGIVLSKDAGISRVGCPSQTLHNEGALAV